MCGFIGITGVDPVAPALYLGLQAVQHRGQDAAGIGIWNQGYITVHKELGLIAQALPAEIIHGLGGTSGIAHVRYPTMGSAARADSQPFMTRRPSVVLAHNGNITNLPELEKHLLSRGVRCTSRCDSEPILLVFGDELLQERIAGYTEDDVVAAVRATMGRLRGSYSVVLVLEVDGQETLVAFRDPWGIRPATYGRRGDGGWAVASESVSLDVLDFQLVGHVPPGSVMFFRRGQEPITRQVAAARTHHCIFEDIYFARPDSRMEGGRVYERRWQLGSRLAEEWKARGFEADVVVPVPDTSRPAAQAIAEALGVSNREGFIKNRYSGRTFIMPDQATRDAAMRLKLNPIEEIFRGRRVLLVDDSIVRGTTMRRIVQMVRKLDPAALHVAIFSPPVRHPCFYGIDMPSREELIASSHEPHQVEQRLAEHFGADSVTFLSEAGLRAVAGDRICAACFTGRYPVPVNAEERGFILKERRAS